MTSDPPTWGDTVRVKSRAPKQLRPGEVGEIVTITEVDSQSQAESCAKPLKVTLYEVEFGDGETIEIPGALLDLEPDD